jgi:hypothetical protein
MNLVSTLLFVLSLLYLVAFFVEVPLFYEGNPKTRFLIQKMGKKNYKLLLLVMGVLSGALALFLR